jgi:hypothetical protein
VNFYTEICDKVPVSSERAFPSAPYPRKYVHCLFDDLYDAVQAVHTLRASGYKTSNIHIMASWDFVEAVERSYQSHISLSQVFKHFVLDHNLEDVYLQEARQGRHILAVRPASFEQILQLRDLLVAHHAYCMKYIDTWTFADLLP